MNSRAQDRLKRPQVEHPSLTPDSGVQTGHGQAAAHLLADQLHAGPAGLGIPLPHGAVQLRTLSYVFFCDVQILIHDVHDPDQAEWDKTLADVAPWVKSESLKGILVRSFGGGPTPHQRRQVIDLYAGKQMPVANVSDSAVTRAITTAISWFYRGTMRSYSPVDLPKAVQYLGVPDPHHPEFLATVAALCAHRGRSAM